MGESLNMDTINLYAGDSSAGDRVFENLLVGVTEHGRRQLTEDYRKFQIGDDAKIQLVPTF